MPDVNSLVPTPLAMGTNLVIEIPPLLQGLDAIGQLVHPVAPHAPPERGLIAVLLPFVVPPVAFLVAELPGRPILPGYLHDVPAVLADLEYRLVQEKVFYLSMFLFHFFT